MSLKIFTCDKNAKIPTKAYKYDAGFDLYACETCNISEWSRKLISIGIKISIPNGYYGRVAPRSGMSVKGIDVGAGVVDSSYRGEVKVLLINNTNDVFKVNIGDRIAQLVVEKIYIGEILNVDSELELGDTDRNGLGFGSSGI